MQERFCVFWSVLLYVDDNKHGDGTNDKMSDVTTLSMSRMKRCHDIVHDAGSCLMWCRTRSHCTTTVQLLAGCCWLLHCSAYSFLNYLQYFVIRCFTSDIEAVSLLTFYVTSNSRKYFHFNSPHNHHQERIH